MQSQPQSQPQTQPQLAKPGPSLRLSLVILFVGLVIAVPSAVKAFAPFFSGITKSPVQTPIRTTMHFSHGTYLVYENDGGLGSSLNPSDVQIFAPSGERVITTFPSENEHIPHNGSEYVGVVSFRISSAGDYGVQINATGHDVIIARSLLDSVKAALAWFALMGLGGIMVIAGVILIIVGSVRRGRAQRMMYAYSATYGTYPAPGYGSPYGATYGSAAPPPAAPTSTPPGWYPDSNNPGSQRWWDGTRWTDHTHP